MGKDRKFKYPTDLGKIFFVRSHLDMDYLRIAMGIQCQDFAYSTEFFDEDPGSGRRFILIDERSISDHEKIGKILRSSSLTNSTVFCYCPAISAENEILDLSENYSSSFKVYANATVRRSFQKSIFFNCESGIWSLVRTMFKFPHNSLSLEDVFLNSINSSRNILTCYDQIELFQVERIDKYKVL